MMPSLLEKLLAERPILLADGATGTNLFAMGLTSGDPPEGWTLEHPDRIKALHTQFVEAGAEISLTNTFGAYKRRLALHKLEDRTEELNQLAAQNARDVDDASSRASFGAGSRGPSRDPFQPSRQVPDC